MDYSLKGHIFLKNAGIREVRTRRDFPSDAFGTDPAGGENIIVFCECRNREFRLTIMTDKVVVVIDIW